MCLPTKFSIITLIFSSESYVKMLFSSNCSQFSYLLSKILESKYTHMPLLSSSTFVKILNMILLFLTLTSSFKNFCVSSTQLVIDCRYMAIVMRYLNTNNFHYLFFYFFWFYFCFFYFILFWRTMKRHVTRKSHDMSHDVMSYA